MEPDTVAIVALTVTLLVALVGAISPRLVSRLAGRVVDTRQLLYMRLINLLVACLCVVFLLIRAL